MFRPTPFHRSPERRVQIRIGGLAVLLVQMVFVVVTAAGEPPEVAIRQSDARSVQLNIRIPELTITQVTVEGQTFDRIRIPTVLGMAEVGDPNLPVLRKLVAIPDCEDVRVDYRVVNESWRDNIRVVPVRQWDEKGEYTPLRLNDAVYNGYEAFPGQIVHLPQVGRIRDQRVALVEFQPLQYFGGENRLRVIEEVEITLTFRNAHGPMQTNAGPLQQTLEAVLVNGKGPSTLSPRARYGAGAQGKALGTVTWVGGSSPEKVAACISKCGADYLIIATNDLPADLIDDLAEERAGFNGLNVAIARLEQIDPMPTVEYDQTAELIKTVIQIVYDDASAAHMADGHLGYVLLLGDAWDADDEILLPSYYGYGEFPSDAYYSFLAGDDEFADILLGRIPVNNYEDTGESPQLFNVVSKILDYNREPGDPVKNQMFQGDVDGVDVPDYTQIVDDVFPDYVTNLDFMFRDIYPEGDTYSDLFSSEIVARINEENPSLIAGYGHGDPMYFGNAFFPWHYDVDLINTFPSLFLMSGCGLGRFDNVVTPGHSCLQEGDVDPCDCIAEALLVQSAGSIGTIAFSFGSVSANAGIAAYHGFYRAIFEENAFSLGEILATIKMLYSTGQVPLYLSLFGDPAVNIMWEESSGADVDLCIRKSNIWFTDKTENYFDVNETVLLNAVVENLGDDDAIGAIIEAWDGDPDEPGSTLLGSQYLTTIPSHGGSLDVLLPIDFQEPGYRDVHVRVAVSLMAELTLKNNEVILHCSVFDYPDGFPVDVPISIHNRPVAADLDPDLPGLEILFSSGGSLICVDSAGNERWNYQYSVPTFSRRLTPCVGAVYKDNRQCCVLQDANVLRVLDGLTGEVLDEIPFGGLNDNIWGQVMVLADLIPDDETVEIVVLYAEVSSTAVKAYSLYQHEGEFLRWSYTVISSSSRGELGVGDLDGDGDLEVVAIVQDSDPDANKIGIIQAPSEVDGPPPTGEIITLGTGESNRWSLALIQDAPGSGGLDILATSADGEHRVSRLASDGTIVYDNGPPLVADFHFSIADLDGDGDHEIVAAGGDQLWILGADSDDWSGNLVVQVADACFEGVPLTADIDGDGDLEILAISQTEPGYHLLTFDHQGNIADVPHVFFGDSDPHFIVEDVNEDGIFDAVVGSSDLYLHVIPIGTASGRDGWMQAHMDLSQSNRLFQPLAGIYANDVSLSHEVRVVDSVTFNENVYLGAGTDVRIEDGLTVQATKQFRAIGGETVPVTFYSVDEPQVPGSWDGLSFTNDCVTTMANCQVSGAVHGIYNLGSIDLSVSRIDFCSVGGIVCFGSSSAGQLQDLVVSNNDDFGILVQGTHAITISGCTISYNEHAGVRCVQSSPTITECELLFNQAGLNCRERSGPQVTHSLIYGNVDGVAVNGNSRPGLGVGFCHGNNIITGNTHLHISNLNEDQVHAVYAQFNYWDGATGPKPGKFMGNVIYEPFLTEPPSRRDMGKSASDDIAAEKSLPTSYRLGHPYPNPFNPTTTIRFEVPGNGGHVSLAIFDLKGRRITSLVNGQVPAGYHEVVWSGMDDTGRRVSSGVYFTHMQAGEVVETHKLVLAK